MDETHIPTVINTLLTAALVTGFLGLVVVVVADGKDSRDWAFAGLGMGISCLLLAIVWAIVWAIAHIRIVTPGWRMCACRECNCRHEVQTRLICDRCEHGQHRKRS